MDTADEQDMENPGGGSMINGANGNINGNGTNTNGANGQHQTPEGSMYQDENDESDIDDEGQDDDDFSQPLAVNSQSLDATSSASSLANLSSLMNSQHLLARYRMDVSEMSLLDLVMGLHLGESDILQSRQNLETLQAVMNTTGLNCHALFSSLNISPQALQSGPLPLPPQLPPNNHPQTTGNLGNAAAAESQACSSSVSRATASAPLSNESSPPRCRNNGESSQGNSRNNGDARGEGEARAAATNPPGANWSFEEQFRQLYELDDNPDRRIFLDDLFSFMQSRGSPISRLPIMAKSVLDLYELYKLVVLRGGLVEVINKKLWQEIIKGLRLPASITSAAFTLRTQYMKYLYPYESEKEKLSTQQQLNTAIETNRRESRRNNFAPYPTNNENLVPRNQHNSLPNSLSLPISIAQIAVANESQHHGPQSLIVNGHPHGAQHHPHPIPANLAQMPVSDYMMRIFNRSSISGNSMMQPQGSTSTPPPSVAADGFKSGLELSRLNLWSMYNQGNSNMYAGMAQPAAFSPPSSHSPLAPANSPEPQREALDLANSAHRSDPISSPTTSRAANSPPTGNVKRNQETADLPSPTSAKRMMLSDEEGNNTMHALRIRQMSCTRENGRKELEISVDIDGILYEGVLTAKSDEYSSTSSSPNNNNNNNNNGKRTRTNSEQ